MAIVAEYRDPAGPYVIIRDDDYAHKTPEQIQRDRAAANRTILEIFARNHYVRQAECAKRYEEGRNRD